MVIHKIGVVSRATALLAFLLVIPSTAAAQKANVSSLTVGERPLASRAELEARLDSLDSRLADDSAQRSMALQRKAEAIRERLRKGDFRTGDLVELRVRGVPDLVTDTLAVNRERQLELPNLPPVRMEGVLYSEVEERLQEALSQYVRDPRVRARALWRIAVVGGVGRPGYYDLSPSTTLSDALMRAGGPSQQAKLEDIEFRREGRNVLDDWEERDVPVETLTLAEIGAQRGDQLFVPQGGGRSPVLAILGTVSGLAGTAFALSRIF